VKGSKRKIFNILAIVMVISMLAATISAQPYRSGDPKQADFAIAEVEAVENQLKEGSGVVGEPKGANGPSNYVVVLTETPLASYRGGIEGLEATNPSAAGKAKLEAKSPASVSYLAYLDDQRAASIDAVNEALGRRLDIEFEYGATIVGYATVMTPEEAAIVAQLEGVAFVEWEKISQPWTDAGPQWINADDIWDGYGGLHGTRGEGIIVGVIDTGIDPWNPSFADVDSDGYDHTNPNGSGNYFGVCDPANTNPDAGVKPYDQTFECNDKVIGAWGYTGISGSPRDENGHGSHTSSTAAGNLTRGTVITTPTDVYTATISGVAPRANIVMYAACCTGFALNHARDQALLDDVDVINYSIGSASPTGDPWTDSESLQWLALRDAGVFVATSAGNNGPGDATIGSPGDIPWITTVGANSHNRAFLNSITLDNGVDNPLVVEGQSMTSGYGPAPVVYAADYSPGGDDARLCADGVFAPGTFNGEIVVCERGAYGRVAKGQTVFDGGAGGYILAQPTLVGGGPGAVTSDPHVLPALHIDYNSYQELQTYVAISDTVGTIAGAIKDFDPAHGDVMAAFSSRGPNGSLPDILVPSVTAPGRSIWAAYHYGAGGDGDYTWNVIQGTSMSSPHVAGAGALMKALHPTWTPAEIQSALMSTARLTILNDDGVIPTTARWFDMGSGEVDLYFAGQTSLVMDVTNAEYLAADPGNGGDPKSLNLASMGDSQCLGQCTWTRTLRNTEDYQIAWFASAFGENGLVLDIFPNNFVIPSGGTQEIVVTATVGAITQTGWTYGAVILEVEPQRENGVYGLHLPVAVIPASAILPDDVTINTRRNAGSQLVKDLLSGEITDLTIDYFGLVEGTQVTEDLSQDPTNGDPYDNLNDGTTFYVTATVSAGAVRFVSEIIESEAPDIDLFVGTGDTPSAGTMICSSTTPSWDEYCDIEDPAAGTWWILVQNWNESASPPDSTTLSYAVVPGSGAGNMTVTGPATKPAATFYDLRVFWDTPSMEAGDHWYGAFDIGSSPDVRSSSDIGRLPVNLIRWEDDVYKEASISGAEPGDTVVYTLTVQTNVTPKELTYWITDTIPTGMTYVANSAAANIGSVIVAGDTVTWTGPMPLSSGTYVVATSVTDPVGCDMPLSNSGAYLNAQPYGINTNPGISGNNQWYSVNFSGGEFNFFGQYFGESLNLTDDGIAFLDPSTLGAAPGVYEPIPTAAEPNNLMAIFWNDFEIVYDQAANRGVSLINLTSGGVPSAAIIEFDDLEPYPAGSTSDRFDFEILMRYDESPGWYETIFAYDNLSGTVGLGSIGLENMFGTVGVQYAFDDIAVTDGMAVCFDLVPLPPEPAIITYEVTVDEDGPCGQVFINTAYHQTDNPGSMEDQVNAYVQQPQCAPTGVAVSDIGGQNTAAAMIPLLVALGGVALLAGAIAIRRRKEA
jgi:uncharacterized repeat protein (TIGR01451 family)